MTPIICAGAGGHASVMIPLAQANGFKVVGLLAADYGGGRSERFSMPLNPDVSYWLEQGIRCACVGIGSTDKTTAGARAVVYWGLRAHGFILPYLPHETAVVAWGTLYDAGLTVMTRAVIQPHVRLGENVLINTGAIVEHGCKLGDHVHVASGAVLGGDVTVGECSHIGIGAVIRQGITIGKNACVGAGAVVVKDVPDGVTVVGNPARAMV